MPNLAPIPPDRRSLSVLLLGLRVSCVLEVCGAFGRRVLGEDFAAGLGDRLVASRSRLSQQSFELGEDLLDRIEVGRVFRQKDEASPDIADRALLQRRSQKMGGRG